ncbi:hypothetical protein NVP1121O_243 [Vibrio phage 1.121.O._10N.286.46.C4]|nr:hypothetical protein NVP1121O_243 [Vibrio phage 1.121.O._10N.286.46.C4]
MKWEQAHVDFRKPIKVWSSSGRWQPTRLLFIKDNYAVVKIKRPNGEWVLDGLNLEWYTKVGTDDPRRARKAFKQLQNVKGKRFKQPKLQIMKMWLATWVMEILF